MIKITSISMFNWYFCGFILRAIKTRTEKLMNGIEWIKYVNCYFNLIKIHNQL